MNSDTVNGFDKEHSHALFSIVVSISFCLLSVVGVVFFVSYSAEKQLPNTRSSCVYWEHDKVNYIIWCQFSSQLGVLLSSSSYKPIPDVTVALI